MIYSLFTRGLLAAWTFVFAAAPANALAPDASDLGAPIEGFQTVAVEVVSPAQADTELETAFRTVATGEILTSPPCTAAASRGPLVLILSSTDSPLSLLLVAAQATSTSL